MKVLLLLELHEVDLLEWRCWLLTHLLGERFLLAGGAVLLRKEMSLLGERFLLASVMAAPRCCCGLHCLRASDVTACPAQYPGKLGGDPLA